MEYLIMGINRRLINLVVVILGIGASVLAQQDDTKRVAPFSGRRIALVVGNKD
jgi:hypothetical protein